MAAQRHAKFVRLEIGRFIHHVGIASGVRCDEPKLPVFFFNRVISAPVLHRVPVA